MNHYKTTPILPLLTWVCMSIALETPVLADINQGLAGYFNFEGDVQDQTANGHHGVALGGLSFIAGVKGNCALFDGMDDYIQLPRMVEQDFSVSFWIRTEVIAPGTVDWWSGLGLVDGEVCGSPAGGDWGIALINGGHISMIDLVSTSQVNDYTWHSVIATRDMDAGLMALYIDGVFEGSGPTFTTPFTGPPWLGVGNNPCDVSFNRRWFLGEIDELRIYDRVLESSEIEALSDTDFPVHIPDPNFRASLYEAGVDLSMNGEISHSEAQAIPSLSCSNVGILDLTGLEAFVNLTDLDVSHNQIATLPVPIPNPERMDLSYNQLTSLVPLIGLTNLTELNASHNLIATLPVPIPNVAQLDLSHNLLTSLPVLASLTNLTDLNLSHNQIANLPVPLPNPARFDVSHNQLKTLPNLIGLTNLTDFDVSHNQIALLPTPLPKPVRFDASHNLLTDLPSLADQTNLVELNVSHNLIATLPIPLPNPAILDISHNRLTELPDLTNLTNLLAIDFGGNRISTLPIPIPKTANGAASRSGLTHPFPSQVQSVSGAHNQLTEIPPIGDLIELRSLDFSGNLLTSLPDLSSLIFLETLDLQHNPVSDIVNPALNLGLGTQSHHVIRIDYCLLTAANCPEIEILTSRATSSGASFTWQQQRAYQPIYAQWPDPLNSNLILDWVDNENGEPISCAE